MTDKEKVLAFADMVNAAKELVKPVQEENIRLHEQIDKIHKDRQKERIVWGIAFSIVTFALILFIIFAYTEPVKMEQGQNLEESTQSQTYTEGATQGG